MINRDNDRLGERLDPWRVLGVRIVPLRFSHVRSTVYMDPRANWKGFLRLSLVTCPIALYPATFERRNTMSTFFRGASRTVRHGETVNPTAIERAGPETPHLQRGALDLYPNRRHHSKPATRLDPTRLPLADLC